MADILTQIPKINHSEPALDTNFEEFKKVVQSRRSIRVYLSDPVPDTVVQDVLDIGLLAPNSSNLQPWEFLWIKDPEKKKAMNKICLSQQAARTAPVLIVCVARPQLWKENRKQMLELFANDAAAPKIAIDYYQKLVPLVYSVGLFSIFGFLKRIVFSIAGIFRVMPRGPYSYSDLREWAVKTTALACENIMLGFRAAGYDSCPMEGFDEVRLKKLLKLPCNSHVVMVISAGKRAPNGVYGPRVRFDRNQFVKII